MIKRIGMLSIIFAVCFIFSAVATDTPVIGILTIPSPVTGHPPGNYSYLPASYVKYMESAGARVIPIPYDASPENITFLLNQVNGVVFIGGSAKKYIKDPETGELLPSNLTIASKLVVDHVLASNAKGENFPLMATCLGWEILLMCLAGKYDILYNNYHDKNVKANVQFVPDTKDSKLWNALTPALQQYSQQSPAFLYDHVSAILPGKFRSLKGVNDVLKITSLSRPVNGGPIFVASAEGRKYPIFGNQFHPEKNAFEWREQVDPPHTPESIEIVQRMARMFVKEARKNNRTFINDDVLDGSLIYNWSPTQQSLAFMQVYTFRTVIQDPQSWPALFNTTRVQETPVLKTPPLDRKNIHVQGHATIKLHDIEMLRELPAVEKSISA